MGPVLTQGGRYRGGLPGSDPSWTGRATVLRCVGLTRVEGGAIRSLRAITDRQGMLRTLRA